MDWNTCPQNAKMRIRAAAFPSPPKVTSILARPKVKSVMDWDGIDEPDRPAEID